MAADEQDELYGAFRTPGGAPVTVAHLGQSLDGFIATYSGDSRFVNGRGNLLHLHRMRALCDALVVGAGTVAADDPQLTTRLVPGPNPLRVVLDPERRLDAGHRVFSDGAAPTLLVCRAAQLTRGDATHGAAEVFGVPDHDGALDLSTLLAELRARGCRRVFIEGGGRTVSAFLAAGLLDRLQITIAPFLMGDGRPAIRLAPPARLGDCRRPTFRIYRMGEDLLYDCELARGVRTAPDDDPHADPPIVRVL